MVRQDMHLELSLGVWSSRRAFSLGGGVSFRIQLSVHFAMSCSSTHALTIRPYLCILTILMN
jgi:hypothetical protein